jgi:hypothetical protein
VAEHHLLAFCPLTQSHPRTLVVGFRDNRRDKLFFRLARATLSDQIITPIAISSFPVGIDPNGARKPLVGLLVVFFLEIDIAGEKRCVVLMRIESKCTRIVSHRAVHIPFCKRSFAILHGGPDFGSSSEGHFAAILWNGQNDLDEIAVVPGGLGFIRKFSRSHAFLFPLGRIRERSGVSESGKAEAFQDGHVLGFLRVEFFKERKRIDKFIAIIKSERLSPA